ncbi:MAG: elongation factor Ts [Eubacterium sp.]|nr:elongation factor Ts [Eubacterium sp.]MCI9410434.1 elongation factor Ts [Eubacterium sp.]
MAISASMVKELRELTGAGMMDCKKALTNTDGDMDKAVDYLRENGLAKAEKKAGRIAAEGIVKTNISEDGKQAAIVEVNSETDFVAKNEKFQDFVGAVASQINASGAADIDAFMEEAWAADTSKTVKEELASMIATIGENMNIRRFEKVSCENGLVVDYIHAGGKIGVLIAAETDNTGAEVTECLKNIAMQIAAMNPKYLSSEDVSEEYKEKEKEVLLAQAKNDPANADKPDNIIEKMIIGRLNKELKEVCLTEQVYVKAENKESVAKYVESVAKAAGCSIKLTKFVRFETGEGLEKKNEDFAAEVAAQLK